MPIIVIIEHLLRKRKEKEEEEEKRRKTNQLVWIWTRTTRWHRGVEVDEARAGVPYGGSVADKMLLKSESNPLIVSTYS